MSSLRKKSAARESPTEVAAPSSLIPAKVGEISDNKTKEGIKVCNVRTRANLQTISNRNKNNTRRVSLEYYTPTSKSTYLL